MAYLNIVKEGDPVLRKTSRPVTEINDRVRTLIKDMTDTMHRANGCGLAAVQVGVLRRIVVVEVEDGKTYQMINPKVVAWSGEQQEVEGCLSIPGKWGITKRPMNVTVQYTDPNGVEQTATGSELLARAFCHEIDHLDGKLFTDQAVRMLSRDEVEEA